MDLTEIKKNNELLKLVNMRATWMHLVVPSAAAVGFWQERTLLYMKNTNNKFVTSDMWPCDLNVTNMDLILIIILITENKG